MAYLLDGTTLCACSRPAVTISKSSPACEHCLEIERQVELKSLAHSQIYDPDHRQKAQARYNASRWARKLAERLGAPVEFPPDADVCISGAGNYALRHDRAPQCL